MKTTKLIFLCTFILLNHCLFAQFKVLSSNDAYLPDGRSFWIAPSTWSQNSPDNGYRLRLHHSTGGNAYLDYYPNLVFRTGATSSVTIMTIGSNGYVTIGYNNPGYKLAVEGDIYCTGQYRSSDRFLKKNITSISGALNKIILLNGVEYNYDAKKLLRLGKRADLSLNDTLSKTEIIDTALIQDIEKPRRIGYIGQDFEKIFPAIIRKDSNNLITIDYTELIPVITEAIKELDSINRQQNLKIAELEKRLQKIENKGNKADLKSDEVTSGTEEMGKTDKPYLEQNLPNPFSLATIIKFYIPESNWKAVIYIYDLQGLQKKAYQITSKGVSGITIKGSELKAGIYYYSLIVDGNEIDTKKMILTD